MRCFDGRRLGHGYDPLIGRGPGGSRSLPRDNHIVSNPAIYKNTHDNNRLITLRVTKNPIPFKLDEQLDRSKPLAAVQFLVSIPKESQLLIFHVVWLDVCQDVHTCMYDIHLRHPTTPPVGRGYLQT